MGVAIMVRKPLSICFRSSIQKERNEELFSGAIFKFSLKIPAITHGKEQNMPSSEVQVDIALQDTCTYRLLV
jgi:hypothetical protein